jgi:hypothetical protein
MYAIKLTAIVPDDRRLVIELPPDAPTGEVEIEIHAAPQSAEPEPQAETPKKGLTREEARAKLLAAGALSIIKSDLPDDYVPLTQEELFEIGKAPPGTRPAHEQIIEDRGEY